MSQPDRPRPVPAPPGARRPVPPAPLAAGIGAAAAPAAAQSPFTGLAGRAVAEHVAVFEAEHERLQAELSTIDQL